MSSSSFTIAAHDELDPGDADVVGRLGGDRHRAGDRAGGGPVERHGGRGGVVGERTGGEGQKEGDRGNEGAHGTEPTPPRLGGRLANPWRAQARRYSRPGRPGPSERSAPVSSSSPVARTSRRKLAASTSSPRSAS